MSGHHARPGPQPRHTPHPPSGPPPRSSSWPWRLPSTTTSQHTAPVAAASTGPAARAHPHRGRLDVRRAVLRRRLRQIPSAAPGVTITYSAVGSSAGIAAISAHQVNFGASDVPMNASEQAAAKGGPITQVPVALGGEGIAYNLNLPAGARLHLTGPVLAGIFLGQITRWNDPAITALNPGITLPPASINVVHRSDGSGTTYIFSNYLSSVYPAWAAKVGTGKTLNWPAGEGDEGNGGVAPAVNRTPFSIGYVEQAYSQGLTPAVRRHPQPGRELRHPVRPDRRRRRRPETRHHPDRLLHRQPARRRQLPDQRIQLGAGLHPPAQPGHRAGPGHHAGLAHPRRPGLRRRQRLRPPPSPDPATRPHHAPAGHRPRRNTAPQLTTGSRWSARTASSAPGPRVPWDSVSADRLDLHGARGLWLDRLRP